MNKNGDLRIVARSDGLHFIEEYRVETISGSRSQFNMYWKRLEPSYNSLDQAKLALKDKIAERDSKRVETIYYEKDL